MEAKPQPRVHSMPPLVHGNSGPDARQRLFYMCRGCEETKPKQVKPIYRGLTTGLQHSPMHLTLGCLSRAVRHKYSQLQEGKRGDAHPKHGWYLSAQQVLFPSALSGSHLRLQQFSHFMAFPISYIKQARSTSTRKSAIHPRILSGGYLLS